MAYTAPTTATAGTVATAAVWNASVRDNVTFLHSPPGARVYNSANLSIPHNVATVLTFNLERFDNDNIHDSGSNTSRLTCRTAGKYGIFGHVGFANNATGFRWVHIRLNGSLAIASDSKPNAGPSLGTDFSIYTVYPLNVGDYVELLAYQESGSSLNVTASLARTPEFGMMWQAG